jgi:endonuclease III
MTSLSSKIQRAKAIAKILERLFPEVPIPLKHRDPFTLLVAVMLSGQSTDKMVNKVTPALFVKADTPQKMVRLSVAEIRSIIKPCGLSPAKSKHIRATAQILVDRFEGIVPQTFEELESLPGVGHKTASVVMSQAFGKPAFPVDTHIHRLAHRWGLSGKRSQARVSSASTKQVEKDLKRLFPEKSWNKLHLQMIYFGRQYCPARGHDEKKCPICSRFGQR